jgi:hypothetical protein
MHLATAAFLTGLLAGPAAAEVSTTTPPAVPSNFAVAGRAVILTVHAEGAQIYQCRTDAGGRTSWVFREPIAALMSDGKTVGRHYLGPTWELADGNAVKGKVSASAPGTTAKDVTQLKLDVVERRGAGVLNDAALVLRLNTHGGALEGACDHAGEFRAEPYSADYAFLR